MQNQCSHGIPFFGKGAECIDCNIGWQQHCIEMATDMLNKAQKNLEKLEAKKKEITND